MKPIQIKNHLFLLLTITILSYTQSATAGKISGYILDSQSKPTSGAIIILTDAKTGIPSEFIESIKSQTSQSGSKLSSTLTDEEGRFSLDPPDGEYNVISQKWTGKTKPVNQALSLPRTITEFGINVNALGVVSNIKVPSTHAQQLKLAPPGSATVSIKFETGNDDSLVVISREPLSLDPIFGFAGWMGDFLTSSIAFNRAPMGQTTFHNMPAGKLHIAIFGNDNMPGFGAAEVNIADGQTTTVQIEWVGRWSNARKTPPARLIPLYNKFKDNNWQARQIDGLPPIDPGDELHYPIKVYDALVKNNKQLNLPDGTKAAVADIYAVLYYLYLSKNS